MGRISMGNRVAQCVVAVAFVWLFAVGDAAKQVQIRRSNGLSGTRSASSSARSSSSSSRSGRLPHDDTPPPSRTASSASSRANPADVMAGSEAEIRRKNTGAHRIGSSSSLSGGRSRDRASAILTDLKTNPQRTGSTRDKTLKGADGQLVSELGVPVADVPRGSASLQNGLARGLGGGGNKGGPLAAISPLIEEIVGKVSANGGGLGNLAGNGGGAGGILNNLMKNFAG